MAIIEIFGFLCEMIMPYIDWTRVFGVIFVATMYKYVHKKLKNFEETPSCEQMEKPYSVESKHDTATTSTFISTSTSTSSGKKSLSNTPTAADVPCCEI